jgi:hypothetical protein
VDDPNSSPPSDRMVGGSPHGMGSMAHGRRGRKRYLQAVFPRVVDKLDQQVYNRGTGRGAPVSRAMVGGAKSRAHVSFLTFCLRGLCYHSLGKAWSAPSSACIHTACAEGPCHTSATL